MLTLKPYKFESCFFVNNIETILAMMYLRMVWDTQIRHHDNLNKTHANLKLMTKNMKLLGIKHHNTSGYIPQSNDVL